MLRTHRLEGGDLPRAVPGQAGFTAAKRAVAAILVLWVFLMAITFTRAPAERPPILRLPRTVRPATAAVATLNTPAAAPSSLPSIPSVPSIPFVPSTPPISAASVASGAASSGAKAAAAAPALSSAAALAPADFGNVAIVVMTYNRPHYLKRTLASLAALDGIEAFSVYVSQDGDDTKVHAVIDELRPRFAAARKYERLARRHVVEGHARTGGTAYLAQHYKTALDNVFVRRRHDWAIIVEDDMIFSPDFLGYFRDTAPLLVADPTLYCVSSWNDNGFKHLDLDPTRLQRTSYFPGLGWMLRRELWDELGPIWPTDHWDHWMRMSPIHKGRECVVPEVSRNHNIGAEGANIHKDDFERFLANVAFNEDAAVRLGDVSYLLRERYDAAFRAAIDAAPAKAPHAVPSLITEMPKLKGDFLIPYLREQYKSLSSALGIFPSPRGHHGLAVEIRPYRGLRLFLADARMSAWVPDAHREHRRAGLRPVAAKQQVSCVQACAAAPGGMVCEASQFDFVNTCEALAAAFPCENGCRLVVGPDIPNYVNFPSDFQHQMCLVTDGVSTCGASHRATQRLCPCVPRK
jgi:alpha-1,3-mannosyl-glycoprotein beta-1,2-N-acetylglucosaminyltransferase